MGSNLNKLGTNSSYLSLPNGCRAFGAVASSSSLLARWLNIWSNSINEINSVLVLAGSKTAEIEGVSSAGATKEARRYTAVADAELLLSGPLHGRKWDLPPLPAGVSPALISYVASRLIGVKTLVVSTGLTQTPSFPCELIASSYGPSNCLTTGKSMDIKRVELLWNKGYAMGISLTKPLLLTECVPGGTTTALAVLTGIGLSVAELISGSHRKPAITLKKDLVAKGLCAADLGSAPTPKNLLAAVGDPFQPFAVGLLLGARQAEQPVLLGGGSQMVAVLAMALASIDSSLRNDFLQDISIGTTSWLAEEIISSTKTQSEFPLLIKEIEKFFQVSLLCLSSGLNFSNSSKQVLLDYERGFIKEGVGAGAFSLLAQLNGFSCKQLVEQCELAVDELGDVS